MRPDRSDPGLPLRARPLALVATACFLALGALLAPSASADRAFTSRFAQMARGDVTMVANTIMTCPSSAGTSCTNARAGTGTSLNNEDFTMTYVDVDSDATTFDSSSANLTLPGGASVLFAGLYWGADTSAGSSGAAAPNAAAKNTVKLKVPGGSSYSTITASQVDTDNARATRYQGFADVTSQVQAAGVGTYTVANVQAGTGSDRWGGWGIVIAYRDTTQNVNWIAVYDGYGSTGFGGGNNSTDVTLTGFQTPSSGTVAAKFGMLSYEGELGYAGETATLNGVNLIDALHPAGNYFDSVISRLGSYVTTKNPNYVNQLGFDANVMDVGGFLPAGSTSATVHLASNLDMFIPGVMTMVNDQVATAPSSTSAPSISGTVQDGQTLTADPGTWSGTTPIAYAYQWQRCDSAGNNCANIGGATSSTYQVTSGDVGSTFRVVVTGTNVVDSASATSGASGVAQPAPPSNTAPPTISGTPTDGQTLTAANGTWTGTPTIGYAYQWQRCDSAGNNCASIGGATSSTYVLASADVGSTLRVVVAATNAGGSASASSAQTAVVAATPPLNTSLPTISGTPTDGQTLTGSNGGWTGTPTIGYAHQWRRCDSAGASCSDIAGATSSTYQLTPSDVGSTLRLVVSASNAAGSASATSAQTAVVAAAPPSNVLAPTVTGTAQDGSTLTASTGTWNGTPSIAYAYQWQRCDSAGNNCASIGGATSSTYVLASADVGSTLRVVVAATNAGGSASASSAQTAVVAATPPLNTSLPTISGTPTDGQTLTGSNGGWTGTPTIGYAHQWRRCDSAGASCSDIAGATSSTYQLTPSDVGSTLRLVVSASNAAGSASATSAQTAVVAAAPPSNVLAPTVTGTAQDGSTLTASTGTWNGTPSIAYAYQWQRCDPAGANCSNLSGATSSTYAEGSADIGHTLRVVVTATNAAGSASTASAISEAVAAGPPVNTSPPTISGTPLDGQTLTGSDGTWSGTAPISFAYQWQRCAASGNGCADIPGATSSTYSAGPSDVGYTLRIEVTATNAAGEGTATSSATGSVGAIPPSNTDAPTITGTPQDGETLSVSSGTWSGTPTISYSYQWRRCDADGSNCADIAGATGATYDLTSTDVGKRIRAEVTATNAGGDASVTTQATGVVAGVLPSNSTPPSISGTSEEGQTLTADPGVWTGSSPISYGYQWRRCDADGSSCVDIAGATGSTYVLTSDDVGHTIVVAVSATNSTGASPETTSTPTASVSVAPPANTSPPTVSGDPAAGNTLTADPGTWTGAGPIGYQYQWLRCDASGSNCQAIDGATDGTYVVAASESGDTFRVEVSASNGGGSSHAQSDQTGSVPGGDEDISSSIPESIVSPDKCQRILAGTGFKRQLIKHVGRIRVEVLASDYISPTRPLRIIAYAPKGKVKSVVYKLDKRTVSRPRTSPYRLNISPRQLARSRKHVVAIRMKPRKTRWHQMKLKITTAPCSNVLSGFQWKTPVGTGLRLRVDSRVALQGGTFTVPSRMLPKRKDAGNHRIGRAKLYLAGGARPQYDLRLAKGDHSGTLLKAASKAPQIRLTKKGLVITRLPAKVGIIEITLYTRDRTSPRALLLKRQSAKVKAVVKEQGKSFRLTTTILSQRH
jgi:predicted actin-binding protein